MSTIRVDNFGPSAGGTAYSARGVAKAWVNFNGTGTIAARDSENVSSLTDNGTGDYTVNFTNAMATGANYAISGSTSMIFGSNYNGAVSINTINATALESAPTTSSCRVAVRTSSATPADVVYFNTIIHGDLA